MTAIPITQTADAQILAQIQEKEFIACLSKYREKSENLFDSGTSCTNDDYECRKNYYEQLRSLAKDFSKNCRIDDPCLIQYKFTVSGLFYAQAAYVHGPNPNDTDYGQMMVNRIL